MGKTIFNAEVTQTIKKSSNGFLVTIKVFNEGEEEPTTFTEFVMTNDRENKAIKTARNYFRDIFEEKYPDAFVRVDIKPCFAKYCIVSCVVTECENIEEWHNRERDKDDNNEENG